MAALPYSRIALRSPLINIYLCVDVRVLRVLSISQFIGDWTDARRGQRNRVERIRERECVA
jgi:hypothetical protein